SREGAPGEETSSGCGRRHDKAEKQDRRSLAQHANLIRTRSLRGPPIMGGGLAGVGSSSFYPTRESPLEPESGASDLSRSNGASERSLAARAALGWLSPGWGATGVKLPFVPGGVFGGEWWFEGLGIIDAAIVSIAVVDAVDQGLKIQGD